MNVLTLGTTRRQFLTGITAAASLGLSGQLSVAQDGRQTLTTASWPAPRTLHAAMTTGAAEMYVAGKMFDGLLSYDTSMNPQPQLAESWTFAEDGLQVTFYLRKNVTWHDGTPFTSNDVAFSMMEVWKKLHGRGRTTFSSVERVDTPDDHTAVFVLSRPAPFIVRSLFGAESTILPAHLYEGSDILSNPHNLNPIGTGPYRFVSFESSDALILEKYDGYWDAEYPIIDRLILRFIPDDATRTALLETDAVQLVPSSLIPAPDIVRLRDASMIDVNLHGYEHTNGMQTLEFNLDNPILNNVAVRHAIAHSLDRNWILKNIWYGFGAVATGPIHTDLVDFYSAEGVPEYDYDLEKANALLDEANFPLQDGKRFSLTIDPIPFGEEADKVAQYMRNQLGRMGIELEVRRQDFGAYVKRVYTDRDFDMNIIAASTGPDPAIGVQRFYWSKNFAPGVGFSNGAHYNNPEVDKLLELASAEMDQDKRRDYYKRFQQIVMADLPTLPLISNRRATLTSKRLRDATYGGVGPYENFARAHFES